MEHVEHGSPPNCKGELSYSKIDCRVDDSQLWIYYMSIIFWTIVCLFAFFLLIYKCCYDNCPLWNGHIFEPITGFLFWLILFSFFRALTLTNMVYNLIPNLAILRSIINFTGWTCGQFAIATYIVGTFKAIPVLTFHSPTANRLDKNCKPTQFIPAHQSVLLIYWSFIASVGLTVFVFSCLRGYYVQIQNLQMYKITQGCILITLSIGNLACILGLLKYGRLLVILTEGSVGLVIGNEQQTYKAYLKKLKIINFALSVVVSWSSIICFIWAVGTLSTTILSSSVVLSSITNIGSCVMMMAAILGIICGELCPKYTGTNTEAISFVTISRSNSICEISEVTINISSNLNSNSEVGEDYGVGSSNVVTIKA